MKRKVLIFSTGAMAVAFAGLAVTVNALVTQPSSDRQGATTAAQQYIVRAENGKVAVFPESYGLPEIETGIDISQLREYDRRLLEQGIAIEGYENMVGLLEDFSN